MVLIIPERSVSNIRNGNLMKFALVLFATAAMATNGAAQTADHAAHHPEAPTPVAAAPAPVEAVGFVRAVNAKAGSVTVAHEAIPALDWPAMTMPFKVADKALLKDVRIGAKVRVQLQGNTIVGLTIL